MLTYKEYLNEYITPAMRKKETKRKNPGTIEIYAWNQQKIPEATSNFTWSCSNSAYAKPEEKCKYKFKQIIKNGYKKGDIAKEINLSKIGDTDWKLYKEEYDDPEKEIIVITRGTRYKYYMRITVWK